MDRAMRDLNDATPSLKGEILSKTEELISTIRNESERWSADGKRKAARHLQAKAKRERDFDIAAYATQFFAGAWLEAELLLDDKHATHVRNTIDMLIDVARQKEAAQRADRQAPQSELEVSFQRNRKFKRDGAGETIEYQEAIQPPRKRKIEELRDEQAGYQRAANDQTLRESARVRAAAKVADLEKIIKALRSEDKAMANLASQNAPMKLVSRDLDALRAEQAGYQIAADDCTLREPARARASARVAEIENLIQTFAKGDA